MLRFPTVYADVWPLNEDRAAMGLFLFILIATRLRNDEGIWHHELDHAKRQWLFALAGAWIGIALGGIGWPMIAGLALGFAAWVALYFAVPKFKLFEEASAYREQMRWPDAKGGFLTLAKAAARLALPLYGLGLTDAQARTEILNA